MEFIRPIQNDTHNLDLTSSSRQDLHARRINNHPFVVGFSQSVNSVIRRATDVIRSINTGISVSADHMIKPFRFWDQHKSTDHVIGKLSSAASGKIHASNIGQQSSLLGRTSGDGHQPEPRMNQVNDDIKQKFYNRKPAQTPNDNRTTEPTNPSSRFTQGKQRPIDASGNTESSTIGLKFSHSRLEGTDLAIDAALLASGMGGVLIMEHLIDVALHTKLKKEEILIPHHSPVHARNLSALDVGPIKSSVDRSVKTRPSETSEPGSLLAKNAVEPISHHSLSRFKR
jgi:hypothetical protein